MSKFESKFDELLLEAWERCTDDERVRASPAYGCLRKRLAKLTSGRRGKDELAQLEDVVRALRTSGGDHLPDNDAAAAGVPSADHGVCDRRSDAAKRCGVMLRSNDAAAASGTGPPTALAGIVDDNQMSLQQFFGRVATQTCDRGALLMRVTDDVLADFRSFVDEVFGNRVTQIGMVLAREQMTVRDKYAELERRTLNRAQLVQTRVREVMPTFDWRRYVSEPGYIKTMVVSRCLQQDVADADGLEDARGKGLLYQLNWLRSEIDRADCENHGLYEQHSTLTAELAAINAKMSAEQCRASTEMTTLATELDDLKARSAEQVSEIDKHMETIQIAMQNMKIDSAAT